MDNLVYYIQDNVIQMATIGSNEIPLGVKTYTDIAECDESRNNISPMLIVIEGLSELTY